MHPHFSNPTQGLAPCLSSSVAYLLQSYLSISIPFTARLYFSGYKGILTGDSVVLSREEIPALIESFQNVGGSPIGSSRVKLTNVADCVKRGYIQEGGVPLEVAAEQLKKVSSPQPALSYHTKLQLTTFHSSLRLRPIAGWRQRPSHHWRRRYQHSGGSALLPPCQEWLRSAGDRHAQGEIRRGAKYGWSEVTASYRPPT